MTKPVKRCVDCVREGVTTKRKASPPGPRCTTHARARRSGRRDVSWEARILATYGIRAEEYWRIYKLQGGVCYICRRATGARKRLSVDHCHKTGMVRGLLCQKCNRDVLGHLRDDPQAMLRAYFYLDYPPAQDVVGVRVVPDFSAAKSAGGEEDVCP